jgi:hypothetical protein
VTGHGVLPGLWPIHGDGVLARQGNLVLLIHPAGGDFTDRLLDLLADAARAGQSGPRFTDLVSAQFEAHASAADTAAGEGAPAVVAFGATGETAIAVYGTGWAEVTTAYGVQRLATGEPYGQLRCVLPSTLIEIRAGVRLMADDDATDPYLRLADGVVRAIGLVFAPTEIRPEAAGHGEHPVPHRGTVLNPSPAEAPSEPPANQALPRQTPPEPEAAPAQSAAHAAAGDHSGGSPRQDFISAPLLGDQAGEEVPKRDPLPLGAQSPEAEDLGLVEMPDEMVEGAYCKNEHFNDPDARYCAVCGAGMGQLTKTRKVGKRPPLGVLILGDGSVCQVDADYVIGREPTLDEAVADGRARPLPLMGASGVVSRIHARVELDGWDVFISDLDSANGTQILQPGKRNPTSLKPRVRTRLVPGMEIRLGEEYALRYDSHRHR